MPTNNIWSYHTWAMNIAIRYADHDNGEESIIEDAAQEALTEAAEYGTLEGEGDIKDFLYKRILNYYRRHRERGYRRQFWQDSCNEHYGEFLYGDNPDFEPES